MKKLCIAATVLGAALGAKGAFVEDFDTFGPSLTDFTDTVTLKKFDPNLGELFKVTYTLEATISGEISADSENPMERTVTLSIAGLVTLKDGLVDLLSVNPSVDSGPKLLDGDNDAFPDFVGTDAVTFPAVLGASDSGSTTAPATLNWFTATFLNESFSWDVSAMGLSELIGSGNMGVLVNQFAEGKVTVRYDYNSVIPETSTYVSALGLFGLTAFAVRRHWRR